MSDIVSRLRETQKSYEAAGVDGLDGVLQAREAADEIEALRAGRDRLRDAASEPARRLLHLSENIREEYPLWANDLSKMVEKLRAALDQTGDSDG